MSNTRTPGYYWVKNKNSDKWVPFEWAASIYGGDERWWIGPGFSCKDDFFQAINEARIPPPDEALYDEIIAHATTSKVTPIFLETAQHPAGFKYQDMVDRKIFICITNVQNSVAITSFMMQKGFDAILNTSHATPFVRQAIFFRSDSKIGTINYCNKGIMKDNFGWSFITDIQFMETNNITL